MPGPPFCDARSTKIYLILVPGREIHSTLEVGGLRGEKQQFSI